VHLHSPLDEHTPPATRVLPNITMADLRDELMRRRRGGEGGRGEDSCITIECHRERHRNIKGRNLERDFESLAPAREAPAAHVMCQP
jgi:hypothetical protein